MKKDQLLKYLYLGVPTVGLIVSILQNFSQLNGKHHFIVYLVVYLYGLHTSYAYFFNRVMYEQGINVESRNETQPIARPFFGIFGLAIIIMCFWGIWVWSNT